jgi:hypothetical protein
MKTFFEMENTQMGKEFIELAYAELNEYGFITEPTRNLLVGCGLSPYFIEQEWVKKDDPKLVEGEV